MKHEGDTRICNQCNVQLICKKISDSFGERLSWRNVDGSPHFIVDEDTKQYVHCPTKMTTIDLRFEEMEERIARIEKLVGIVRVE